MTSRISSGPFEAFVAITKASRDDAAVISRWIGWLEPYWAATFAHHALPHSNPAAPASSARVRHVIDSLGQGRFEGALLAALFGPFSALATQPDLRCSTLTNPSRDLPARILVALSRPDHSSETLAVATWLATQTKARLFGVHVVASESEATHPGAAIAGNAKALAFGINRTPIEDVLVEVGSDVATTIQHCASTLDADVIIVGARRSKRGPIVRAIASDPERAVLVVADARISGARSR